MEALAWVVGICAALFFGFAFTRKALALLAILAVLGLGIWGYLALDGWLEQRRLSKIVATVSYDLAFCSEVFPVRVLFENRTGSTILQVWFNLFAHNRHYSQPVLSEYSVHSDRIIKADESVGICLTLNDLATLSEAPGQLAWSAQITKADLD